LRARKAMAESPFSKFVEDLLVGSVESIARGVAKGFESVAQDAVKAVEKEKKKIESLAHTVKTWREVRLGEVDSDLPSSLRDDVEVEVEIKVKPKDKDKEKAP
jgi:hypothetical protein